MGLQFAPGENILNMDVLENAQNQAIEDTQKANKRIGIQDLNDTEGVELRSLLGPKISYKMTEKKPDEDGNEVEEHSLLPYSNTQTYIPKQTDASHGFTEFDEVDAFYRSTKTETVQTRTVEYENGNKAKEERKETKHTKECCADNCLKYFLLALIIVVIGVVVIVVVVVTQQKESKPPTEQGRNVYTLVNIFLGISPCFDKIV